MTMKTMTEQINETVDKFNAEVDNNPILMMLCLPEIILFAVIVGIIRIFIRIFMFWR